MTPMKRPLMLLVSQSRPSSFRVESRGRAGGGSAGTVCFSRMGRVSRMMTRLAEAAIQKTG